MPKLRQLAWGVTMNWIALGASVIVSFFLAPFVVHRLGNTIYGVWVLVNSLVSYMALLDLGLRGAVTRFVSKGFAQGDHAASSRALSAAFWMRVWIGLGAVFISGVLAIVVGRAFHIPSELRTPAQWVAVVCGINFAVSLTSGVFGGVLSALQRFDLLSAATMLQTLLSAAGIVLLLRMGHGIIALAIWQLCVATICGALLILLSFRNYPQLVLSFHRPDKETLRQLWNYSSFVFIINLSHQIVYYTDNLVVGAFLSATAVTFYAIGGNLVEYLRNLVSSLTSTFTPLASTLEAQEKTRRLQQLLIYGTRAGLFIALPVELALFFRGHTFIGLWMGAQYSDISGHILRILLLAQFFILANGTSGGIAYGLGRHRPVAFWALGEGIANLALSVFLVRRIGISGVAWGTVIPSLVTYGMFWPWYSPRLVGLPVWNYLWQSWIKSGLSAIPFGVACYYTDRFWVAKSLLQYFMQIAAILPLFAAGIAACFWSELYAYARKRFGIASGTT
jgi:O-antigen/teichoic acid export membrane protein